MGEILSLLDRARLFQGKRLTLSNVFPFSYNLVTKTRFMQALPGLFLLVNVQRM